MDLIGDLLGPSSGPCGTSWKHFGLSKLLKRTRESLKARMNANEFGPPGGILEPSWAVLGTSWAVLRPSWSVMLCVALHCCALLCVLLRCFALLGVTLHCANCIAWIAPSRLHSRHCTTAPCGLQEIRVRGLRWLTQRIRDTKLALPEGRG